MDRESTRNKIAPFVSQFNLNPGEFVKEVSEFQSFNDFFFRKLKPEARPINPAPRRLCYPQMDDIYVFRTSRNPKGFS